MLHSNLSFEEHLKSVFMKVNKKMGLTCKFRLLLPRKCSSIIYKPLFTPYLDKGDVIYDETYNQPVYKKLNLFNKCNNSKNWRG